MNTDNFSESRAETLGFFIYNLNLLPVVVIGEYFFNEDGIPPIYLPSRYDLSGEWSFPLPFFMLNSHYFKRSKTKDHSISSFFFSTLRGLFPNLHK